MGTECIENTSDTVVEEGSRPDQIRVRPRWYRLSPFRRRTEPTPAADGTPYYEDAGGDLFLVGDDLDDQVAPSAPAVLTDRDGELGRNGLTRRTLPTGEIALYAEPANGHETLTASAGPITGISGQQGTTGEEVSLATVSLSHEAGAFPLLVRPRVTVTDVRVGYATQDVGGTAALVLPAVAYQLRATGTVVTESGTPSSLIFDGSIGLGGTYAAQAFVIPARGTASMEVRGGLIYNGDIPSSFPIPSAGTIRLDFEIVELTDQEAS